MSFNSFEFALFFPVVTVLYFALPHRHRWALLLAASCAFYMSFVPIYITVLFFTIIVDYWAGLWIEGSAGRRRKVFLLASLVSNIGVLAIFKYANFLNENVAFLARALHWNYPVSHLAILLPIGLSFHTFQAMSYTIEVYRGRQKAERRFGIYALYVMFYPQLVAGPIERPQHLLPQFDEIHHFEYRRVTDGLKLMAWGLFKKAVIADRLAATVNLVYARPTDFDGVSFVLATAFFTVQIYCDFSGYSDIAIGAAQVMGFRLMQNFNHPYHAKSVAEFWRRWHISLTSWFKDYIYTPLGAHHLGRARACFNLLLVFLICGLWHGANWTFVIWGGLNGLFLCASFLTLRWRRRLRAPIEARPVTAALLDAWRPLFLFGLMCFSLVFFRASSLDDAVYILAHLGTGWSSLLAAGGLDAALARVQLTPAQVLIACLCVAALEVVYLAQKRGSIRARLARQPGWLRWSVYYGLAAAILLLGVFTESKFIYFQF